jgi:hypothetical protein
MSRTGAASARPSRSRSAGASSTSWRCRKVGFIDTRTEARGRAVRHQGGQAAVADGLGLPARLGGGPAAGE